MGWRDFWRRAFGGPPQKPQPQDSNPHRGSGPHQDSGPQDANVPNSGPWQSPTPAPSAPVPRPKPSAPDTGKDLEVRRYFYNEAGFQTYGSFFSHWGGWLTAGHVVTEASGLIPPFASGEIHAWPDGLDACTIGCRLPAQPPDPPRAGQNLIIMGYPAGSRHLEERRGSVYFERAPGVWIAHIQTPDEPVVTGMSGGVVIDAETRTPIGILITRNSPADLNADRDPDESADFVALTDVWHALAHPEKIA